MVHHTNKSKFSDDPFDRVSGSNGIMGSADTTILLSRERDKDTATVKFTGRDVFGNDFVIRLDGGRWMMVSDNATEYAAAAQYESHPLVGLFRHLMQENRGGGRWTYEQLKAMGLELLGAQPFIDARDLTRQLGDGLSGEIMRRDGLLIECAVQLRDGRGIRLRSI